MVALSAGLRRIPKVRDLLTTLPAALFQRLRKQLDELSGLCQRIDNALWMNRPSPSEMEASSERGTAKR